MSTRSVIIRYNTNTGNFETAYKHHDGYANTGYLNVFYNTPKKAEAFLAAIMKPGVELRGLAPTVEACEIEQNKHYGYTLYPAPVATDRPEKYLPGLISHGDAEFITLYTPHGWKEFAVESGHFFKASKIRSEEYADYAERMKKSNSELVALWHHVKALATGAPMPSEPRDRRGEPRWGYIYGGKALPIEQRLFAMGTQEYSQVLNTTAKELFNCSDGWSEFFSCTGAQVLYVEKSGEVCFKINPRFMANKANVVKCILWPGNAYATAEFYKTSTKDGKKELTRLDNSASGYPCNHKEQRYRFLDAFRQLTALQTFNPLKRQEAAEKRVPAFNKLLATLVCCHSPRLRDIRQHFKSNSPHSPGQLQTFYRACTCLKSLVF